MKLRVLDNSIRLRLRRSEVEQLAAEGVVEAVCELAGRGLRYGVTTDDEIEAMSVDFDGSRISIRIPALTAQEWAANRQVGLRGQCGNVALLVEKDFVRSAVKEADDYDRFANPRTGRVPPPPPAVT